jgi:outer membrane protein insertion porin family
MSFTPSVAFPLSQASSLSLTYNISNSEVTAATSTTTSVFVNGDIIKKEINEGNKLNSSIAYKYIYDNRRKGLNTNAGVLFQFGQEIGGFGGDSSFVKTNFKSRAQTKIMAEEVTVSVTLEGGTMSFTKGSSRVNDRYLLGSAMMRGFDANGIGPREIGSMPHVDQYNVTRYYSYDDALRGTDYAVAQFEAQFPLGIQNEYGITGGIFYDVGSLWGLDNKSSSNGSVKSEKFKLRHTVGFSLFWKTVIGPLRFNFMDVLQSETHDKTESFELTISSSF